MLLDTLLRFWHGLLTALGLRPTQKPAAHTRPGWVPERPLHNTEKYYLCTPLQRLFCLAATIEPAQRSRLTKQRLVDAVAQVASTPGFFALACNLSHASSESAARWCAPNSVDVVRQLIERSVVVASGECGVGDTVERVIERELATDFDLSNAMAALWRLVVLPASGAIVWTFQHCLCDGMAARDCMQLLMQRLAEDGTNTRIEPFVRPPLLGAMESLLPSSHSASSWMVAVRKLLSKQPPVFTGPVTDPLPRSALCTRVHIEQLTSAQTLQARATARARGVTMHGLILAASAAALRTVFQPGTVPCSFVSPISLRAWLPADQQRGVGNFLTAFTATHRCCDDGEDEWQFARRYMAALKQAAMTEYRTQAILAWLGARLGMAAALAGNIAKLHNLRTGSVEVSNLGAVDSMASCATLSFHTRMHNNGPLLLLGPVSTNGRLNLSLSYCEPLVSKEQARLYVEHVVQSMAA